MRDPSLSPYLWMLGGSFSFAWMTTAAHALGASCDWRITAMARSGLVLVFAVVLARLARARLVWWRPRILWVRSLAGSVSLVCTFYALPLLPQSYVLTLTSTYPLWVALLSWPLYHERPGLAVWLSVAASIAGVALIQLAGTTGPMHASLTGFLAALLASFATAVALLGLHRLQGIDPRAIVVHFSAVASIFCFAVLFVLGSAAPWADAARPDNVPILLAVGVTATIGQLFLTRAFAAGPPTRVAVVGLTQVLFALVLDVLIWQHPFSPFAYVGMALIIAPTAWVLASQGSRKLLPARAEENAGFPETARGEPPSHVIG